MRAIHSKKQPIPIAKTQKKTVEKQMFPDTFLHNMSAPPVVFISLSPVHARTTQNNAEDNSVATYGIVNITTLFKRLVQSTLGMSAATRAERLTLLAEHVAGQKVKRLKEATAEELFDRFTAAMKRIPLPTGALPDIAFVSEIRPGIRGIPVEDPVRALFLISRLSETLFIASRKPHFPPSHLLRGAVFYVPKQTIDNPNIWGGSYDK